MFRRAPSAGNDEIRTGIDDLLDSDSWDAASATGTDGTAEVGEPAGPRPVFRTRLRGYDPLQVDNFVARTEWEILSARRHADHLLDRFGACSAELENARRLLAVTPKGWEPSPVPEGVGEILRLAADEATRMIDAAGAEADQLLAEARVEADARLHKARTIEEMAVSAADDLLSGVQAERDRLEGEARSAEQRRAAAAQELAALREELADLQGRRDEARSSLRLLTDQIGRVLEAADPAKLVSAH